MTPKMTKKTVFQAKTGPKNRLVSLANVRGKFTDPDRGEGKIPQALEPPPLDNPGYKRPFSAFFR